MRRLLHTPSYAQGYAQPGSAYSANPDDARGLLGLWMPSMGATGKTLLDLSGRRNDGTIIGDVFWDVTDKGTAINFSKDASSGYVSLGSDLIATLPTLTVRVIARMNSTVGGKYLIDSSSGVSGFAIRTSNTIGNIDVFFYRSGGLEIFANVVSFSIGEWVDLVAVMDLSGCEVYKNGVFQNRQETVTGSLVGSSNLNLGAEYNGNNVLDGFESVISIHDRPLSPQEITHMFEDPFVYIRRKARVYARAPAAGGLLVHPGMTGGMKEMAGGVRG